MSPLGSTTIHANWVCYADTRTCYRKYTRNPAVARIADSTGCQWHSRSSKVNDFHCNWQSVYHFH